MSDTPRTDIECGKPDRGHIGNLLDAWRFARTLERDLAAANATIADLKLQVCKPDDCGKNVRIAELERECEYDQRNAAMSQSESVQLLDRIAELEAELAALKAGIAEQYDQIGRLQESNKEMWAKEAKAVKELAALKAGRAALMKACCFDGYACYHTKAEGKECNVENCPILNAQPPKEGE